ncbi:MAG: polysaccharide biosynthesis protein, partial [Oscillospiraceae bacterium]|nr:polysaccharide biosynthesis protein [Oscillospiraceae bacterium]
MRVLVLSCNTGEGHNSTARALKECFEARGHFCQTEDALEFISPAFSRFVSGGHTLVYRYAPFAFRFGYKCTEGCEDAFCEGSAVYKLLTGSSDKLLDFCAEGGFDALVSTHVFPALMAGALVKNRNLDIKTYYVTTDYTLTPGTGQSAPALCFIPDKALHEVFTAGGVDDGL